MEQAITPWEAQHLQIGKMISLPAAQFVQRKRSLLVCMDSAARDFIAATDFLTEVMAAEKYEQDHLMASTREAQRVLVKIRERNALEIGDL